MYSAPVTKNAVYTYDTTIMIYLTYMLKRVNGKVEIMFRIWKKFCARKLVIMAKHGNN